MIMKIFLLHKSYKIFLCILSILFISGCWDSNELQDFSIISGIGIDKGGDDPENRFRTTVQIINPSIVSGGQQGGSVQSSPVTTYSETGSTLKEALRKISNEAPAELFFPHIQIMLIGEELAKEGIDELFDVVERDPKFRVLFPVLIVKGHTAEDALKVSTSLRPIPSAKIEGSLQSSKEIWGEYPSTRADQAIMKLGEGSAAITGIEINGDVEKGNQTANMQEIFQSTKLEIKGLAIIREGKLEKWLEGDPARGVVWVNNEMEETVMNLDCPEKKDAIAIDIGRAESIIKAKVKKGKPVITIRLNAEGAVSETHCSMELDKDETIKELEEQLRNEIKEEVQAAIKTLQEEKSDVFGFGEYINIEDKNYWKKIKDKWEEEIFPESEVNIEVNATIRRTGMKVKSYIK
ncbi:Ger(x)C family spore germination protein [Metabacillus halosaccharovorans]|uniref:Ger(X)C family spore germination protein n=1 Tax=Metabacillus halosaccharovorans TaxID=930124 RepID=A0ABT3DNV1_9BACI|nr:Ger(x)C family spore germination protein [Metabacillus halosaccharovorans]MCV9888749.1 Ger(x)C family spore germination protein [Metabacillus halosaccharovorans]